RICQNAATKDRILANEATKVNCAAGLFQLLEHLLGDVLVAGLRPVVAVVRQEALRLVLRVVLLPVVDECLTEVHEQELLLPGDRAGNIGQGVQLLVESIAGVVPLAPASAGTLDDLRPALLQLVDQLLELSLELLRGDAGAGIVDTDLD